MKNFALIGCGKIAGKHAENMNKVGKLVAVCDVVKEKRDAFASHYAARAYDSIENLLLVEDEIDVVAVCTPNGLHAEHAIKSLQGRKHVLCENPLCLTSAAAWQIIETEKFCRRKLFVVKSTRYNPLIKEVKKAITENSLGKIYSFHLSCLWNRPASYYADWRGKVFPDGGSLYTQFSQYIDAMLWLLGDVAEVRGYKNNAAHTDSIEFEDTGVAALQMQNGILGSMHWSVNSYKKNHEIALTLVAEKGTIRLGGEYLNQVQYAETEGAITFGWPDKMANDHEHYHGSMSHHQKVYENLIQVLDNNGKDFTGAYDGLKTVETIEKIYKAIS